MAFDLLALRDDDHTRTSFAQRRAALERGLQDAAPPVHVTPITRDIAAAHGWFERFEGAGLDGLIVEAADLTYQPDDLRGARWRPDRDPGSCGFAQLDRPARFAVADVAGRLSGSRRARPTA